MAVQAQFIQEGLAIDYTPVSAVAAGAVVVQGSMIGVTKTPIAAGKLGSLAVGGVFDVVKANEQQGLGAALYWDADGNPYGGEAGTGCATTTSTSNTFIGYAMAAAGATDATVRVLWSGPAVVTSTIHETISAAIADPGDAGAIAVTGSGNCPIVTTGAETRTLAAPTFAGQQLLLHMKTDGSDAVVAVATGINQTGNNRITLNDAGDTVLLAAIAVGANLRWRVICNDGATLSTV